MTSKITFLRYELENGKLSLKKYILKKKEALGEIQIVKDLEMVIGIISYARRMIKGTEEVLAPLRKDLKMLK